jgi:lipid-binding SYLF domain-containing protein
MRRIVLLALAIVSMTIIKPSSVAFGQFAEEGTVQAAAAVLNSTMSTPLSRIPQAMLTDAHAVAIIPNVIKGSFVIGARRGRGLLFVRESDGVWHAPIFITLTGGNIGWQVGVQSSDIILVFKTRRSVDGILSGKLTLGADAAAAAGPVGRQGGIATDARLAAEIYTYSRSRGLFAGVSIDGSVLRMDPVATGVYYGRTQPGQAVVVPQSAITLTQAVAAYAGSAAPPSQPTLTPIDQAPIAQRYAASEADVLRGQLSQLAPELYELLDEQWAGYLALPSSMFLEGEHPDPLAVQETVAHFDRVASDTAFQSLAARPEFQSVYGVLKHYQQSLTASSSTLQLPPPPVTSAPPR